MTDDYDLATNALLTLAAVCLALSAYWQIVDAVNVEFKKIAAPITVTQGR